MRKGAHAAAGCIEQLPAIAAIVDVLSDVAYIGNDVLSLLACRRVQLSQVRTISEPILLPEDLRPGGKSALSGIALGASNALPGHFPQTCEA